MSLIIDFNPHNHYRFLLADNNIITLFTYFYYLEEEAYKDMSDLFKEDALLIGWF